MQSTYEQLRALPSLKLVLYLVGLFGVLLSLSYIHAIKPAFAKTKDLQAEHQQLTRLVSKFDLGKLDSEVAEIKQQQDQARLRLSAEIPDRKLDQELPTILESLHDTAKSQGLRTRKIQPAKVEHNSEMTLKEFPFKTSAPLRARTRMAIEPWR